MADRDVLLKNRFQEKPESIIHLPHWMLADGQIAAYLRLSRLAIVEVAGRDSVAAAILSVQEEGFTDLLPVYAYTGTEYGSWATVEEAVRRLRRRLTGTRIHDLLVMGSPRFWHALNGRLISEMITRYGFYTPCVGCHLYLHAVRIPLARLLKAPIVAGERERHDGAVKVNQTATALKAYQSLAKEFDVPLLFPLRRIDNGSEIEEILGFHWNQNAEQLGCVLSGNYMDSRKRVEITEERVRPFLTEFALPLASKTILAYGRGRVPNHRQLAFEVLESVKTKSSHPKAAGMK